jgi:diadenosine tetraphosphate (Ap4A) HIT family hydrolase
VLVSPLRPAARLGDLQPDEVADMFRLAQAVAARLERHYEAAAATVAVQDGAAAGQTVRFCLGPRRRVWPGQGFFYETALSARLPPLFT